jgi:hypothetical protein
VADDVGALQPGGVQQRHGVLDEQLEPVGAATPGPGAGGVAALIGHQRAQAGAPQHGRDPGPARAVLGEAVQQQDGLPVRGPVVAHVEAHAGAEVTGRAEGRSVHPARLVPAGARPRESRGSVIPFPPRKTRVPEFLTENEF